MVIEPLCQKPNLTAGNLVKRFFSSSNVLGNKDRDCLMRKGIYECRLKRNILIIEKNPINTLSLNRMNPFGFIFDS
jgi:hypothetical protein